MPEIISTLQVELNDVFQVMQMTRGTLLEDLVAADLVMVEPHETSQIHRHNNAETVLYILAGSGVVRVGDERIDVQPGERVLIGKGVFHGVKTNGERMVFISVQSPPILNKARGTLDLEPLEVPESRAS